MKILSLLKLSLAFLCLSEITTAQQSRDCGTMQNLDELLQKDPDMRFRMGAIERHTAGFLRSNGQNQSQAVKTIPVVVHIVYNLSSQNISDAQVQSQLAVLNADFRRTNSDASNTPNYFANIAADIQIEFCLAVRDPSGNPTTGITRTQTSSSSFSTNNYVKYSSYGGKTAWPAGDYLNLWVCNLGGGTLGYAQFPGGAAATDGVVIDYAYFGSGGSAQYPYNKGRTATHEVGHWLNLRHIWGDSYCGNDYVGDTPTQSSDNGGCPGFPRSSCNNYSDMFMNYMDYTNDACMNAFTAGQSSRMNALFSSGGYRVSLLNSQGCVPVGAPPPPGGYCASQGNDASYEWIAGVSIGSISNTSGTNGGFGDYTGQSTDLEQGSSYNLSLTPGFASSVYQEYWKVYIDYNQDNDFGDAGELVFDAGALSSTVVNGSFSVASTSTTGVTRMRVSMKYNGSQTSCESFAYGEVEDYTVNIQAPCPIPYGLSVTAITESTATLNWAATGASSYDVGVKATAGPSWSTFSATGTSLNLTGMAEGTEYEFRVRSVCSLSNSSAYSGSSVFTTLITVNTGYCNTIGSDASYEWIAAVSVGSLNNSSVSNGGYGDFTSIETDLIIGQTYAFSLLPGFASTTYDEYWKIWIDFNGDGDFADPGEKVFDLHGVSKTNVNGLISIPSTVTVQNTRMRVSMKYNGEPTACETFNYGEVEDYAVNIINAPPVSYCASGGGNASYEWIGSVEIGSLYNSSGNNGGYNDFTDQAINMDVTMNYNLILTPGFNGTSYNEYWKIWVDLNADGDFEDIDELVFDAGSATSAAVTGVINLPDNATLGMTRMRVSMKWDGSATSCEDFSYGEVEDYSVFIVDGAKVTEVEEMEAQVFEVNVYPNPALGNQTIRVAIAGKPADHNISIYDGFGKIVYNETVSPPYKAVGHEIILQDLAAGVYFVNVQGQGFSQTRRLVVLKF
ncbi:MAG: T9SS type A sorting domain-containing protein [Flavobacteriales bacterium]|nr:T9SS type A sorting domain-containing protein [Flavobacteriales bacterium]